MDVARDQLERLSSLVDAVIAADPTGSGTAARTLAATVSAAGRGPAQVVIVATDFRDLADKLVVARSGTSRRDGVFLADPTTAAPIVRARRTVFLYPGQGSQRPARSRDVFVAFPRLRGPARRRSRVGRAPFQCRLQRRRAERGGRRAHRHDRRPACGCAAWPWPSCSGPGRHPGHHRRPQLWRVVALAVAGADDPAPRVGGSSHARVGDRGCGRRAGRRPLRDGRGRRLDRGGRRRTSRSPRRGGRHQRPRSGRDLRTDGAVAAAVDRLGSTGVAAKSLKVACVFHSPAIVPASGRLAEEVASTPSRRRDRGRRNTTAHPYPADPAEIRALLAAEFWSASSTRSRPCTPPASGVFVEAGPVVRLLTQLVGV